VSRKDSQVVRGFTLVELLVCIVVVAVLFAILLPALARVRLAAYATRCAANLSLIGIACHEYSEEFRGLLPNNSYTLGDNPSLITPPISSSSIQATYANTRGVFSTCNYEWFDAITGFTGWGGGRTVASRYADGEDTWFRASTSNLWCPCVDQSPWDPGIFATSYGIPMNVSVNFDVQEMPRPLGTDAYSYDFLAFSRVPRPAEIVFLAESQFWNFNADAYHMTNGSLGDLSEVGTVKRHPQVDHYGLNYLFFDGHVSRETSPPNSFGGEIGNFTTCTNNHFTITAAQNTALIKELHSE